MLNDSMIISIHKRCYHLYDLQMPIVREGCPQLLHVCDVLILLDHARVDEEESLGILFTRREPERRDTPVLSVHLAGLCQSRGGAGIVMVESGLLVFS